MARIVLSFLVEAVAKRMMNFELKSIKAVVFLMPNLGHNRKAGTSQSSYKENEELVILLSYEHGIRNVL